MSKFTLGILPPQVELETKEVLRQCVAAHRCLAELKGICGTIPDENILINTLTIQEAKDSSAVENIITTHDELFKEELLADYIHSASAKEVLNYTRALKAGFLQVKTSGLLTCNTLLMVQAELEKNRAGYRKLPGTELKNDKTGEIVYVPPQNEAEIIRHMTNLEKYLNYDDFSGVDPLIKMAVAHYQFESIHPFYDGNGRTGRIMNILYLVRQKLLEIPVLYLSRYLIKNKMTYYSLLQAVRDESDWQAWLLFMLKGVEATSLESITIIQKIRKLMNVYRENLAKHKFYSRELLEILFVHPYTKIEFLEKGLDIDRKTAAKYLNEISETGLLKKEQIGTAFYFVNEPLYQIFLHKDNESG